MQKTGIANLPLHHGKCPRWLFPRMEKLAGEISEMIIHEHGKEEFLRRISDPFFFQALGCVIGFDWHSSGLTTTTLGALKESVNKLDLGVKIAGGKGKVSRKTQSEIESSGLTEKKTEELKYASRMAAKVDNNLVQDGYRLYHHCFIFTERGEWAVVQQGMNSDSRYARRYHWFFGEVESFVEEPQKIACDSAQSSVLDMTARESGEAQKISVDLVKDNPVHLKKYFSGQKTLGEFFSGGFVLTMPSHHPIYPSDLNERVIKSLQLAYEIQPTDYEELVSLKGIGAKSIRALALVSELVYGKPASWKDPVKYSFAHGGKDGFPYPVDRENYDASILTLKEAIESARLGDGEKISAIKRLSGLISGR